MQSTQSIPVRPERPASVFPASASGFSYESSLRSSQRANWKLEDVIGPGRSLDFSRAFLPDALARTEQIEFLSPDERRLLNQIRGHGYLYTFGLVEEFILPFVLDHARTSLDADSFRTRALLQFAGEEAKHIQLFERFREAFRAGFGSRCDVIGPPAAIAEAVLARPALSVALVTLQIEWMTQRHYLDSVADDDGLDPQFKSLLRHHWMEEAQHARLDTLMVLELAANLSPEEIARGVAGYLEIGALFDAGFAQQARFDVEALERAFARTLPALRRERLIEVQHQSLRWTFLGSGMTHPRFVETLERLGGDHAARVAEVALAFA